MRPPWCLHRVQAAGVWARICPFGVGIFSRPRWADVPRPERAAGNRSSCPSSVAARRRAAEGADGLRPARRFNLSGLPSQEPGLGASLFCYKYSCESEEKPRPAGQPASPSGRSTRPDEGPGSPTPCPRWPGRDPLSRPAQHEVCRSVINKGRLSASRQLRPLAGSRV